MTTFHSLPIDTTRPAGGVYASIDTTPPPSPLPPLDGYAIVEIMGHDMTAGRISQYPLGSTVLLLVETPELPAIPPSERPGKRYESLGAWEGSHGVSGKWVRDEAPAVPSKKILLGAGAIFRMTLCDVEAATNVLQQRRELPPERFVPDPEALAALEAKKAEDEKARRREDEAFADGGGDEENDRH